MSDDIEAVGICTHNLKNISLKIPLKKWTVVTGVSGSGKSSLVFDTIYAQAQRRFLETFGTYERQFLQGIAQGKFFSLKNLPAAIALKQNNKSTDYRSVIATSADLEDGLCTLFINFMDESCSMCGSSIILHTSSEMLQYIISVQSQNKNIILSIPLDFPKEKAKQIKLCQDLLNEGYIRLLLNGKIILIEELIGKDLPNVIEIVLDIIYPTTSREELTNRIESLWAQLKFSVRFGCIYTRVNNEIADDLIKKIFYLQAYCPTCANKTSIIKATNLNWRSVLGACVECSGIGYISTDKTNRYRKKYSLCPKCLGAKIGDIGKRASCFGKHFYQLFQCEIHETLSWLLELKNETKIAKKLAALDYIYQEVIYKLSLLVDLGLGSAQLFRRCKTLSGGEYQRVLLTRVIGNGLSDTLYVLDEPSIGLGKAELPALINCLKTLRDLGNTVLMVEHDTELIKAADHIIELGLQGGEAGGHLLTVDNNIPQSSILGEIIPTPNNSCEKIAIKNFSSQNCKHLDFEVYLEKLNVITGPSGAGKSTLIYAGLAPALEKLQKLSFQNLKSSDDAIGTWDCITAPKNFFQKYEIVTLTQQAFTKTIASVPATLLGLMDILRKAFAQIPEAKQRHLQSSHFSFNGQGKCKVCNGRGIIYDDLFFLGKVEKTCPDCNGTRYKPEILEIYLAGKNIHQWLNLTLIQSKQILANITDPIVLRAINLACELGLGYLLLGAPTSSLSGGELQRLKICAAISQSNKKIFCILDEPTRGLSEKDIGQLLNCLLSLKAQGHTFVIVEHHAAFVQHADYLIQMGPGAGRLGGKIVKIKHL